MVKSKIRRWCEETAHEFGCSFTKKGKEWMITQRSTGIVAYKSDNLISCQRYLINEIGKVIGKNGV
jgi:hypothetical protein